MMENKNSQLNEMMRGTMEKVREMVDTNTIVGQPITTPDGVTLIPISKVSFGFGSGGGDYGKTRVEPSLITRNATGSILTPAPAPPPKFSFGALP